MSSTSKTIEKKIRNLCTTCKMAEWEANSWKYPEISLLPLTYFITKAFSQQQETFRMKLITIKAHW